MRTFALVLVDAGPTRAPKALLLRLGLTRGRRSRLDDDARLQRWRSEEQRIEAARAVLRDADATPSLIAPIGSDAPTARRHDGRRAREVTGRVRLHPSACPCT
jgi:hypothetical protein